MGYSLSLLAEEKKQRAHRDQLGRDSVQRLPDMAWLPSFLAIAADQRTPRATGEEGERFGSPDL